MDSADSLESATNRLALAALSIAIAALLATTLQVVLEYTSSSNVRHKVSPSAINIAARQVKMSWSLKGWKWKFYYPQINFGAGGVLHAMASETSSELYYFKAAVEKNFFPPGEKNSWAVRGLESTDPITSKHVCDGVDLLVRKVPGSKTRTPVKTSDLPWGAWFRWQKWKFQKPTQDIRRPRATWAQIIRALGLKDVERITVKHVDGDTIPANIDVPIQRVKLFDIGMLSIMMGFTRVSIDVASREFRATGPFGTITTEEVQNFGKVLRFEGDMFAIYHTTRRTNSLWNYLSAAHANGKQRFRTLQTNGNVVPLKILTDAISGRWRPAEFEAKSVAYLREQTEETILTGHLPREADLMENLVVEALKDEMSIFLGAPSRANSFSAEIKIWKLETKYGNIQEKLRELVNMRLEKYEPALKIACARWQRKADARVPTILATSCFAALPIIANGFPSRALLNPYGELFQILAREVAKGAGDTFRISPKLQQAVADGSIGFLMEDSRFIMASNEEVFASGHLSWGYCPLRYHYNGLPDHIRLEIDPQEGKKMPTPSHSRDGQRGAKAEGPEPWNINGLVMPQALRLLQSFNPTAWAKLYNEGRFFVGTAKSYRTENLLWMQILVLDISIRILIRGSPGKLEEVHSPEPRAAKTDDEELLESMARSNYDPRFVWDEPEVRIVKSVTHSWRPEDDAAAGGSSSAAGTGTAPSVRRSTPGVSSGKNSLDEPELLPWDVLASLEEHSSLPNATANDKLRLRKLADLLKLRALFFVAFLQLIPDSTDIFHAETLDVEMPII